MRNAQASVLFLLLSLGFHVTPGSAEQPTPLHLAPPAIPGRWTLTPLVVVGSEAPESGGRHFEKFTDAHWLKSASALVFWGHFGPGDRDRALYSLRSGTLKRILTWDTEFRTEDGNTGRVGKMSELFTGRRGIYFSDAKNAVMFLWDGDRLARYLGAGDEVPTPAGPRRIDFAWLAAVDRDGRVLIVYRTSKPKKVGWLLDDGSTLTPLCMEGEPMPGLPAIGIKWIPDLAHFRSGWAGFGGGAAVGLFGVTGAPYKSGVFALAPGKGDEILRSDGLSPVSRAKGILEINVIKVGDADHFALKIKFVSGRVEDLLFSKGRWSSLQPRLPGFPFLFFNVFEVGPSRFLPTGSSLSFYYLGGWSEVVLETKGEKILEAGVDVLQSDGERVVRLLRGTVSCAELKRQAKLNGAKARCSEAEHTSNPSAGVAEARETSWIKSVDGDVCGLLFGEGPSEEVAKRGESPRLWLIDTSVSPPVVGLAPVFRLVDGRTLALEDVIFWTGPGEALFQKNGWHRLAREPEAK